LRFWDSSAVVPLVVAQPATVQMRRWFDEDGEIALWTLTPVEVISALRRLAREGRANELLTQRAEQRAWELADRSHVVSDVERVKSLAVRLLRLHALSAADALQLGAALVWTDGNPKGQVLYTLDRRMALAALKEGFRALPEQA
jgi:predicted nucleic acid-binding protein